MVIKKPYAFLIKNFRLIHAALFIMLIFITVKSFSIYTFFGNYAQNHVYNSTGHLADTYAGFGIFAVTILALAISFVIYYILSMKDKSTKTYLFIIIYYLIFIVYLIYLRNIFNGLEEKALDIESIRAMRDLSIIVIVPQFVILFIILGRTLGFNLKQFDFKRDLEELEIDTSDNEEVELTVGGDTYKIARFFRKSLRLAKYFVLENKIFVIGTASIIIFIISYSIYSKYNVYRESYSESQDLYASQLSFNVKASYLTDADMNNIIINKDKYFLLVDVFISNTNADAKTLDRNLFRLSINNELLLPSYNYTNKFSDLGDIFVPGDIKGGEDKEYLVVFEINRGDLANEYLFKINDSTAARLSEEKQYKDVFVYPSRLNENQDLGTYTIPNEISFKESILKSSSMTISSVDIADKFKERYTYTVEGKEEQATYSILPSSTNKSELLIMKVKANIKMDQDIYLAKKIKTPADFLERYAIVRYRYQGYYKSVKLTKIDVEFNKDSYAYMEVNKEIEKANKIDLIFLIRGKKYTITLK